MKSLLVSTILIVVREAPTLFSSLLFKNSRYVDNYLFNPHFFIY